MDKNDRWVLLAGALLGGAFEYACSVFTEICLSGIQNGKERGIYAYALYGRGLCCVECLL